MTAFALGGAPFFALLVFALYRLRRPHRAELMGLRREWIVETAKGLLFAIPAVVVGSLLAGWVSISYRPVPLYLYVLLEDHAVGFVFLAGFFLAFGGQRSFVQLVSFACGFFWLIQIIEIVSEFGRYGPYDLFLLPALRLGTALYLPLLFIRFREWYGLRRVIFAELMVLVPLAAAAVCYLYQRFLTEAAIGAAAAYLMGALVFAVVGEEH